MTSANPDVTIVGVPKEVKDHERRAGMTPGGALEFTKRGHCVIVETDAGLGSGYSDEDYVVVGCEIVETAAEVYGRADLIVKVKEPIPQEYPLIRRGQVLFTFFHFAADEALTKAMVESGSICIACETVEKDGVRPLLLPMSEVAGKLAIQNGAKYLEKPQGGLGILLGGVPGVKPAKVVVIGGGVVGANAAKVAAGMGADVVIMDIDQQRLRYLDEVMPKNVTTLYSMEQVLVQELASADLVVGGVLVPGAKAPKVIRRDHLKFMKKGSVIVDVAVDQGGCCETTHATTHAEPVYEVEGVIHYCVANMPGAVPFTSTPAFCSGTLPFGLTLAQRGWKLACAERPELRKGLSIAEGHVACKAVAATFGLPVVDANSLIFSPAIPTARPGTSREEASVAAAPAAAKMVDTGAAKKAQPAPLG